MITIYNNLEAGQNKTVGTYWRGDYGTLANPLTDPTNLFDAYSQRTVTIVSFMNITESTYPNKPWLDNLKAMYNDVTIPVTQKLIMAVLYRNGTTIGVTECDSFMNTGFDNPADPNYIPFLLVMNSGAWSGSAADTYRTGLDGTIITPFTYIIYNRGGGIYRITCKLHRQCLYDGETAHSPLSDMAKIDWSPTPYALSSMQSYVMKRLSDHLGADSSPTVHVSPDTADSPISGQIARVSTGSKLRFTFSEKAVGAGLASNYRFTVNATPHTDLFSSVSGLIPDTNASTPDGLLASQYLAGAKETWEGTFADLSSINGSTLEFDPSLIVDGSNNTFALDAANTSPLQFLVDTVPPTVQTVSASMGAKGISKKTRRG